MHYLANSLHTIHLKKAFLCVLLSINFVLQLLKTRQNRNITFLEYSKVLLGTRDADLLSWIQLDSLSLKSSIVIQCHSSIYTILDESDMLRITFTE